MMKLHDYGSKHEIPTELGKKNIPLLSFFTGGGFLDLGFESAGFEIIWTNEINSNFADMYEYGFTSWRKSINPHLKKAKVSERRSIAAISSKDITDSAFSDKKPSFLEL